MLRIMTVFISTFLFLFASCDSVEELSKRNDDEKNETSETSDPQWGESDEMFLADIFEFFDDASNAGNGSMLDVVASYSDGSETKAVEEGLKLFSDEKIAELAKKLMGFADKDGSGSLNLDEFLGMRFKAEGEMPEELKTLRTEIFNKFAKVDGEVLDVEGLTSLLKERKITVKRVRLIRRLADRFKADREPPRERVCLVLQRGFGKLLGGLHINSRLNWLEKCKEVEDDGDDEEGGVNPFTKLPLDLKACETVADCVLVSDICFSKAINKKYEVEYAAWVKKKLEGMDIMCPAVVYPPLNELEAQCVDSFRPSGGKVCRIKLPGLVY